MTKTSASDELIATEDLSLANVPTDDAELDIIESFCLTIEGYEDSESSVETLLCEAERIERAGLQSATLKELRLAAFIRQRELRWTTFGDEVFDAPLIGKMRRLVAEIRRRIAIKEGVPQIK